MNPAFRKRYSRLNSQRTDVKDVDMYCLGLDTSSTPHHAAVNESFSYVMTRHNADVPEAHRGLDSQKLFSGI